MTELDDYANALIKLPLHTEAFLDDSKLLSSLNVY